jgi:dUTP pyrophosphatase
VCVILFNFGNDDFQIKTGDRIAQFIIEKITETEAEEVDDLDNTERGQGGFGSTGVSEKLNNGSIDNNGKSG